MFKNNGDCPKIKNSNRLSIGLVALITLFVLIFIITVLGYRSDFVTLHTQNEQETQKRLEIQAEQGVSKKERQELRDRLIKLETEVNLLKNKQ